jgi:hypothetical protein
VTTNAVAPVCARRLSLLIERRYEERLSLYSEILNRGPLVIPLVRLGGISPPLARLITLAQTAVDKHTQVANGIRTPRPRYDVYEM